MSEWLQVFVLAAVIYGGKALPLYVRFVPRTKLTDLVLDLMPAGLMTALLFPTALLGAAQQDWLPGLLVLASVAAAIFVSYRTDKPALGIGAGLVILAIAEVISA